MLELEPPLSKFTFKNKKKKLISWSLLLRIPKAHKIIFKDFSPFFSTLSP